jgi:Rieske Fe-S protein
MSETTTGRRGFLSFLTGAVLTVLGLLIAVPALAYLGGPLRRKRDAKAPGTAFADAGPVKDLPVGEWRLRTIETVQEDGWKKTRIHRSVWARRDGEDPQAVTVLSPICPHLGCPVNWHPDDKRFSCPCHGGIFDASGQHVAGPPPRGMDPLAFEVRGGRLWVQWQDFKIGVAGRVPVNV